MCNKIRAGAETGKHAASFGNCGVWGEVVAEAPWVKAHGHRN